MVDDDDEEEDDEDDDEEEDDEDDDDRDDEDDDDFEEEPEERLASFPSLGLTEMMLSLLCFFCFLVSCFFFLNLPPLAPTCKQIY